MKNFATRHGPRWRGRSATSATSMLFGSWRRERSDSPQRHRGILCVLCGSVVKTVLVDQLAGAGIQQIEAWPALRENALEVRTDHALVSIFEFRMKVEDRFARALHEALRLAVRDRH